MGMSMEVLEPEKLLAWIAWRIGNRSVTDFADEVGIDRQSLYDLLKGRKRKPSDSMLQKLGLRIVYEIVKPEAPATVKANPIEATPTKRKK